MRPLRALTVYIAVVFIGGALLAPWLYWLAQHFAQALPGIARQPFHRFVNRSIYGLALIGLWPLFKKIGAASLRDVGLVKPAGQWKNLGTGFQLGFASLALVVGLSLLAGARTFNTDLTPGRIAERIFSAAIAACAAAVLEEVLFRGGLFGGLRRALDWRFALVVSSMVYALVHFFAPVHDPAEVKWNSGLSQLVSMMAGFTCFRQIVPGFFNLTLAGSLLAFAYQRTGNLYFSIGLHAGWIFWLKTFAALTLESPGASIWWWGTDKLINGWSALLAIALAFAIFTRLPLARKREMTL